MTKTKITLYLALIFIAGAIAGGALLLAAPRAFGLSHPPRSHGSHEDFANFIWNKLKSRLELNPDQIQKVEPIFRAGFAEVRAIQERSIREVEAAIRKNHEEIEPHLTEKQRLELQEMDQERQDFFIKRGGQPGASKRAE